MRKTVLSLVLASALGCAVSPQLAQDEVLVLQGLREVHVLISSGAAPWTIEAALNEALALDPTSAVMQRLVAQAKADLNAKNIQKVDQGVQAGILILETIAPTGSGG